jgi:hypothetical protein
VQDETTQTGEPMDLPEIIRDTCKATGTLDYAQIIAQLTKNTRPEEVVRELFGIAERPDTMATRHDHGVYYVSCEYVLRHLIDDAVSPEDKLIYGVGLSPLTAQAIVALMDSAAVADEAAADLAEALGCEDFSTLCRQVQQMSPTKALDAEVAADLMLIQLPVLREVLGMPRASREGFGSDEEEAEIDRFPCAHNAAGYVLAAFSHAYTECLDSAGTTEQEA